MHLPAVAAIVDDRVEREVPVPNPGRLAPPQDVSYPRCRSQPVGAPTHGDPAVQGGTVGGNGRACGCSRSGRLRRIRRSEGNRLRWERSLLVIGATLVLVSVVLSCLGDSPRSRGWVSISVRGSSSSG